MSPEEAGWRDATANRESWLQSVVAAVTPWFAEHGYTVPPVRVSVGWPSHRGTSQKRRVVGQCWPSTASDDGIGQIFISPVRGAKQSAEAVETLIHELIHAVDDCEHGHKGPFVAMGKALGLCRPWTATSAGEELQERIEGLIERLGPMPSGAINGRGSDSPAKQTARMMKVQCPDCGCTARMSQKWIDLGLPTCACGIKMEVPE